MKFCHQFLSNRTSYREGLPLDRQSHNCPIVKVWYFTHKLTLKSRTSDKNFILPYVFEKIYEQLSPDFHVLYQKVTKCPICKKRIALWCGGNFKFSDDFHPFPIQNGWFEVTSLLLECAILQSFKTGKTSEQLINHFHHWTIYFLIMSISILWVCKTSRI